MAPDGSFPLRSSTGAMGTGGLPSGGERPNAEASCWSVGEKVGGGGVVRRWERVGCLVGWWVGGLVGWWGDGGAMVNIR